MDIAEKPCGNCKKIKAITEFNKRSDRKEGYASWCRTCYADNQRKRYKSMDTYREQQRQWAKTTYYNLKNQVIAAYGDKCACCGESEPGFLTIDHIYGDGASARRNGEGLGGNLYLKLKKLGFPKDRYQLLCYNCNCSKRQCGVCPHTKQKTFASAGSLS